MGRYVSQGNKRKRRDALRARHRETRAKNRSKNEVISKRLHSRLRSYVSHCGLNRIQISDFSGLVPSKITEFLRGYKGGLRFTSFVSLANVAGYELRLVKLDPRKDEYREHRRFAPPPLD